MRVKKETIDELYNSITLSERQKTARRFKKFKR